jgi:DNA (cytosine-5)-methyltransferase 1
MKLISLFSGIGGFELAAEWIGWTPIVSCEINPFGRQVLEHYWPNAYHHDDIHTLTNETITAKLGYGWNDGNTILTGGFPCQPYSLAGKRLGKEDDRHLWPEMLRVIREIQPRWVVGENVFGIVNWDGGLVFNEVQTDLEAEGYEVQAYVLPAAAVNAPHRRDRVWFVAYSNKCAERPSGTSCRADREGGNDINEQKERREQAQQYTGHGDVSRTTLNSNNTRRSAGLGQVSEADREVSERNKSAKLGNASGGIIADTESQQNKRNGQKRFFPFSARVDEQGIIADTKSQQSERMRFEQRDISKSEQKQFRGGSSKVGDMPNWASFPTTEPTIRDRNDGLSDRLAGITFPKWRQESIKAMGNAIVPQVALQIFKTIEAYEKSNS